MPIYWGGPPQKKWTCIHSPKHPNSLVLRIDLPDSASLGEGIDCSRVKHVLMNPNEAFLGQARREREGSSHLLPALVLQMSKVEVISRDFLKHNCDHSEWGLEPSVLRFHFLPSGHTCKGVSEMTGKSQKPASHHVGSLSQQLRWQSLILLN